MAVSVDAILQRADQLATERATFSAHWQEVREVVLPVVASFTGKETPGAKGRMKITDSTPEDAAERLAAALDGMLTGQGATWFHLVMREPGTDPSHQEQLWLEHAADVLHRIFNSPQSGFRGTIHEAYLDLVCFGTACLFIADRPGAAPLFQTRPLSEVYLTENHEGRVDGCYRRFDMTARQVVQQWPDTAGEKMHEAATKAPQQAVTVVHAVFPRQDRMQGGAANTRLPFASVWIASGEHKRLLSETGFHEFPFLCPRWIKRAGEVYGRGPGMKALPDARMLQRMGEVVIVGGEKVIDPPLLVADDGVVGARINIAAGGYTMYRSGTLQQDPIKPLLTGGRPDIGEELMASVRERIRRAFYGDLLQVMQDPKMTATQVIKLEAETLRILSPIVGRLQVELLEPAIERTFGIAMRAGFIGDPPPSLQGREITIEYLSPVARSAKLEDVRGLAQTIELLAPLADRGESVMDLIDTDAAGRYIASVQGVPAQLMRDPEVVQQIRTARQQAAAQQADTQTAIDAAPAVARLAKAGPDLRRLVGS